MAKLFTGIVLSTKMAKTAVVSVERKTTHPLYKKIVKSNKKYKAHVPEGMKVAVDDTVVIRESRPISRDKHFIVEKVVSK